MCSKLEREARKNWDLFYKANKTNFYKDRNYIKYEFTEMAERITGEKVVAPAKASEIAEDSGSEEGATEVKQELSL